MFKTIITIFIIFVTSSAWADQLIIEPDMGRAPIINAINEANHSIDLVMYGFTDEQILKALLKQRTKTLNIILERSPYKADNENIKTIRALNNINLKWHGSVPPYRLVHEKSLIIDNKKALVMTFNFTRSTFKNERNFALVIDDPSRVNTIKNIFTADWNHKTPHHITSDFILSPDDSRKKITALIKQAKTSIRIYAQSLNDYHIVGELAKAARKGINVEVLTSMSMRGKQITYLTNAGVVIRQSHGLYIHAKVIIIDNQLAVIGSINLTRASLEDNRELAAVTHDWNVIKTLNTTFDRDWSLADTEMTFTQKSKQLDGRSMLRILNRMLKLAHSYLS